MFQNLDFNYNKIWFIESTNSWIFLFFFKKQNQWKNNIKIQKLKDKQTFACNK
jgi:hypothetical protein